MKNISAILGFLFSLWYTSTAQIVIPTEFEEKEFVHYQNLIPYRLFTPKPKNHTEKFPLIVALHGAENFASPRDKFLMRAGTFALEWLNPAIQESNPCYVLAPHIYKELWASSTEYDNWMDVKPRDLLVQLINQLVATGKVDPNRIYLTGHSMGGMGALMMPIYLKNKFAAIVPFSSAISSDSDDLILEEIDKKTYPGTSMWTFHHSAETSDVTIRDIYSRLSLSAVETYYTHSFNSHQIEALINLHPRYLYTEYSYPCINSLNEDVDCHMSVMGKAIRDTLLTKWLFKQYKIDPEAIVITSINPRNNHEITWQAKNIQDTVEIWFRANKESGWTLIRKTTSENNSINIVPIVPASVITTDSNVKLIVLNQENFAYGFTQVNISQPVTGISNEETKPLVVYPNPASGMAFIKTKEEYSCKELRYSLISLIGTKVKDGEIINGTIDISGASAGIYFILIKSCLRNYKQKLVILN